MRNIGNQSPLGPVPPRPALVGNAVLTDPDGKIPWAPDLFFPAIPECFLRSSGGRWFCFASAVRQKVFLQLEPEL